MIHITLEDVIEVKNVIIFYLRVLLWTLCLYLALSIHKASLDLLGGHGTGLCLRGTWIPIKINKHIGNFNIL